MSLLESQAEQILEFKVEAKMLAKACQETIEAAGLTVQELSPETGIITAKKPYFSLATSAKLVLTISKREDGSAVQIKVSAHDSPFYPGEAQKFLGSFMTSLSAASRTQK